MLSDAGDLQFEDFNDIGAPPPDVKDAVAAGGDVVNFVAFLPGDIPVAPPGEGGGGDLGGDVPNPYA